MKPAGSASTAPQLLLTATVLCWSYFSDSPFLGGLLDEELVPDALLRRRVPLPLFFDVLGALKPTEASGGVAVA